MTALWISTAALTLAALAALLLPMVLRKRTDEAPLRAQFDLTVYKDQLTEIDRDVERGVLSADQANSARTEIERRMLAVSGDTGDAVIKNTPAPAWLVAIVVFTVPLGAFALYFHLGQPAQPDRPYAEREQPKTGSPTVRKEQIVKMIGSIRDKIKQDPENPQNWAILGQANQMVGDTAGSVQAYEQLVVLTNRNPDALMVLGEALFMDAGEVVTPAAAKLFQEAKQGSPNNPMTYYYLALGRQAAGDLQGALDEYASLLNISPADGEWVSNIQARMTAITAKAGLAMPVVKLLPAAKPAQIPATGPTQQQINDAQNMSAADQQAMIQTMVNRLADKLKANPDDLAGWKRLANAYKVQGDTAKMAEAQAQIDRLQAASPGPTQQQIQDAQSMSGADQQAMIQTMVNRLADKLKANPDDLGGWKRLANAYKVLGDTAKMAEAQAQIDRLQGR